MEQELKDLLTEGAECIKKEDFERGIEIYLDILNTYKDAAEARKAAYTNLVRIWMKQGKLDLAEDYLKNALSSSPLDPGYHYMLGTVYFFSKQMEKAVRELEVSVQQDPDNLEYQKMLYLAEDTARLLSDEIPDFRTLDSSATLERRISRFMIAEASSFLKEGNLKKARQLAENALEANPGNERAKQILKDVQNTQLKEISAQTRGRKSPFVIYQFRAKLRGISPPIWRRFQVSGKMSLYKLHLVLQELMGWDNYHLFEFLLGETRFSLPYPEDYQQSLDASRYKIEKVVIEKSKLLYRYDFGDGWEVELKAEKVIQAAEPLAQPVCLSGKRAGPPEDSGGIPGYEQYLEILRTPPPENPEDEDPEIRDMREWIGDYDPERFDIEQVNQRLKGIK